MRRAFSSALRWFRADMHAVGIADPAAGPRSMHGSTRYTFASHLYRAGAPWRVVESMTHAVSDSWAEGSALPTYAHADWETVCRAILLLPYARGAVHHRRV